MGVIIIEISTDSFIFIDPRNTFSLNNLQENHVWSKIACFLIFNVILAINCKPGRNFTHSFIFYWYMLTNFCLLKQFLVQVNMGKSTWMHAVSCPVMRTCMCYKATVSLLTVKSIFMSLNASEKICLNFEMFHIRRGKFQ